MDLSEAQAVLRRNVGYSDELDMDTALETVLAHLDTLERRFGQVEGGHYLRYAPPVEVARWIRTGNREAQTDAV